MQVDRFMQITKALTGSELPLGPAPIPYSSEEAEPPEVQGQWRGADDRRRFLESGGSEFLAELIDKDALTFTYRDSTGIVIWR